MNWPESWLLYALAAAAACFIAIFVIWHFYGLGKAIQTGRARELFSLQLERLEKEFLVQASAGGLPRGLRWTSCEFSSDAEFARERQSGQIVALVSVTVRFEAVEDGDMAGLPAVPIPRQGSAVLRFNKGEWTTRGRVIFNLGPAQVLTHFASDYELLHTRPVA
jgi:hypothetical protein